ncbi:MAG: WYL domain-containing protein [Alcaligenaceae bacterium]|jgi:predicted DNA-binding transcriptional regulator YafY|uniref:helix-turn-helix transcriptional regulator n=1 Tax=Advenella alkanexedens TaxID=1481665 RepID=UPI0016A6392F|nr:WYL domain-containing protein [Advenella alkanexedens]NLN66795.1 WYL domain-containing protein [Alcaligenaceae bacterium]WKU20039.1 WYL domain-containing protein [Advenella alkanexedens]
MKSNILANRLADITAMAYSGQSLNIAELAEKYQVSSKTIRRDFNRLCTILERCPDTGNHILSASARSQYNEQDLVRLIDDIGLKKALPLKAAQFLRSFINDSTSDCYHFQEQPLEADFISSLHGAFETAIKNRRTVTFLYKDTSRTVSPYLMVYSHGSWYLAAVSEGVLKTFSLARIKFVSVQKEHFAYDPSVVDKIKEQDSIWFGSPIFNVTLEVSRDVAFYFERKALLPKQKIIEKRQDGSLVISSSAWSYNQIAPIVQYWIPNIRIISPSELETYIRENLTSWIAQTSNKVESTAL